MDNELLTDESLLIRNIKSKNLAELHSHIKDPGERAIKIMSFNPRSVASIERFESFKELISTTDCAFDIIVLSESWIKEDLKEIYELENYNSIHSCRENQGYGGVALYYHKSFELYTEETKYDNNYNMIQVQLKIPRGSLLSIIACYRSPINNNSTISPFLIELESRFQLTGAQKTILVGDINLDADTSNQHFLQYENLLQSYCYSICNSYPTREESNTRIDHVSTNFAEEFPHTIVTCPLQKDDIFFSDHSIIVTLIELQLQSPNIANQCTYQYVNHRKIEIELNEKFTEQSLLQHRDPTACSRYIADVIAQSLAKNQFNKRKLVLRKNVCEWMNNKVKKLIKDKDYLKRIKSLYPSVNNENKFQEVSRELNKAKKIARQNYYDHLFEHTKDSKATWNNINKVLGRNKKKKVLIRQLKMNNGHGHTSDENQIVNELNEYFSTVGNKMASTIQISRNDSIYNFNTLFYNHNSIGYELATSSEVLRIIRTLKTGKAPGYDGLTTQFIRKHELPISEAIMILFNMSLQHGKFPENLKVAKVIPIGKGGNKDESSNYRPISLLPTIGKIMEKLMHARLHRYYEKEKFINKFQYGFRSKCSTSIAATELVHQLQSAVDKGKTPTTIFLDVSKAFDTVKHGILLEKSKSKYIVYKSHHRHLNTTNMPIFMNDAQIEKVKVTKYLGLNIDENLTWIPHIEHLSKDISKPIGIIHKLKNRLNREVLRKIYFSLIHSKLTYMITVWSSAKETYKKVLYVLQNRSLKAIYRLPVYYSTRALYGTVARNILNVSQMSTKCLALYVHQCLNEDIHHNMLFEKLTYRQTRAATHERLKPPDIRTTRYGLESIKNRAIKIYNDLPTVLRTTTNMKQFKMLLHKWILETHY